MYDAGGALDARVHDCTYVPHELRVLVRAAYGTYSLDGARTRAPDVRDRILYMYAWTLDGQHDCTIVWLPVHVRCWQPWQQVYMIVRATVRNLGVCTRTCTLGL